jgi:hypothetical protein
VRQRNYLIMQAEEQRGRWECEKEGWERSAEALVVQRNKAGSNTTRDEVWQHFISLVRFLNLFQLGTRKTDVELFVG